MNDLSQVKKIFESYPQVKLAYLFGSMASGENGPMSDYDFAVYLEQSKDEQVFNLQSELMGKLCSAVKSDDVDLVVLNSSDKPELNYEIITNGKLLKEVEPNKLIVETNILNSYFDFVLSLRNYKLTAT